MSLVERWVANYKARLAFRRQHRAQLRREGLKLIGRYAIVEILLAAIGVPALELGGGWGGLVYLISAIAGTVVLGYFLWRFIKLNRRVMNPPRDGTTP